MRASVPPRCLHLTQPLHPSLSPAAFKSSDAGWAAARGKGEAAGDGKFSAFLGEYVAVPTEAEVATVSGRCGRQGDACWAWSCHVDRILAAGTAKLWHTSRHCTCTEPLCVHATTRS